MTSDQYFLIFIVLTSFILIIVSFLLEKNDNIKYKNTHEHVKNVL